MIEATQPGSQNTRAEDSTETHSSPVLILATQDGFDITPDRLPTSQTHENVGPGTESVHQTRRISSDELLGFDDHNFFDSIPTVPTSNHDTNPIISPSGTALAETDNYLDHEYSASIAGNSQPLVNSSRTDVLDSRLNYGPSSTPIPGDSQLMDFSRTGVLEMDSHLNNVPSTPIPSNSQSFINYSGTPLPEMNSHLNHDSSVSIPASSSGTALLEMHSRLSYGFPTLTSGNSLGSTVLDSSNRQLSVQTSHSDQALISTSKLIADKTLQDLAVNHPPADKPELPPINSLFPPKDIFTRNYNVSITFTEV